MASGVSLLEDTLEIDLGSSGACSDPASQAMPREGPLSNSGFVWPLRSPGRSDGHRLKLTYFILCQRETQIRGSDPVGPFVVETFAPSRC